MLEELKASAWTVVKSILIGGAKLAQDQDRAATGIPAGVAKEKLHDSMAVP
jgi:hypothetical protein